MAAAGVLKRGMAKMVPVCTGVPALASRVADSRQLPSPGSVDIAPLSAQETLSQNATESVRRQCRSAPSAGCRLLCGGRGTIARSYGSKVC